MAGEMWATICEGSQYERGAVPRWRGREAAESARRADRDGTTLFQLKLITRALVDGKLEPAQDCLLLAGSDEQDPMILVRGIDDLRNISPECTQRGFQEHGSSMSLESKFTVEDPEDRRVRYLAFPLDECSDPEYWQSLHHHDGLDEDDSEAEGDETV